MSLETSIAEVIREGISEAITDYLTSRDGKREVNDAIEAEVDEFDFDLEAKIEEAVDEFDLDAKIESAVDDFDYGPSLGEFLDGNEAFFDARVSKAMAATDLADRVDNLLAAINRQEVRMDALALLAEATNENMATLVSRVKTLEIELAIISSRSRTFRGRIEALLFGY
jgi:hypothetical protein